MYPFFRLWFGLLARCFRPRHTLLLENLALRQQLTVLKRKHRRPKVSRLDKLFWVLAHQRRIAINLHEGKLSVMSDLEPRIRDLIRLSAAEADPEKRKALAEDLERLLRLEPRSSERRRF